LLASLPRLDRRYENERLYRIKGQPPSLVFVPPGCAFHPRCAYSELPNPCASKRPELQTADPDHMSACHFATTLDERVPKEL
jgi:oligopeptide/dipeptide ABC transporter ATP-binding protein